MTCASDVVRPGFVPVPAAGVETAYLDGEAVLYHVAKARPILLNPTGSAVWMLLDGESSIEEITEALADIFEADPAAVRVDVDALVTRFGELGLLDGVDALEDHEDASGGPLVTGGPFPRPPDP